VEAASELPLGRLVFASVAQLAEPLICNQEVAGSSPAAGSSLEHAVVEPATAEHDRDGDAGLPARSMKTRRHSRMTQGAALRAAHSAMRRAVQRDERCRVRTRVFERLRNTEATSIRPAKDGSGVCREGRFPSGQRGQTVNLLAQPSAVRIRLSPPTLRAPRLPGPLSRASLIRPEPRLALRLDLSCPQLGSRARANDPAHETETSELTSNGARLVSAALRARRLSRGRSSMVERQPSKLIAWVRFPSPAPTWVRHANPLRPAGQPCGKDQGSGCNDASRCAVAVLL
jgi:hypothetical protein